MKRIKKTLRIKKRTSRARTSRKLETPLTVLSMNELRNVSGGQTQARFGAKKKVNSKAKTE